MNNNQRFGGLRQAGFGNRERLLLAGASISIISAVMLLTFLLSSNNDADALQKPNAAAPRSQELNLGTVSLLAPVTPVAEGTRLGTVQMTEIYWPRAEVPEGAVRRDDDIEDLYAKVDLPAKQPVVRANLSSAPLAGGLADLIPAGNRAVTIEVDATSGVEGWATPGAHVDVLVTFNDPADGKKKTQIAIEDAVVISYNGNTKTTTRGEVASRSANTTVTLSVQVSDAVKLYTARAMGQIGLILRNNGDRKSVGEQVVSTDDFSSIQPVATAEPEEAPAGFARYYDSSGKQKELQLKRQKWQEVRE